MRAGPTAWARGEQSRAEAAATLRGAPREGAPLGRGRTLPKKAQTVRSPAPGENEVQTQGRTLNIITEGTGAVQAFQAQRPN